MACQLPITIPHYFHKLRPFLPNPTCSVCHAVKEDPAVLEASETHIVALFNADHRYELQGDWATTFLFSNAFRAVVQSARVPMS